MKLLTLAALAAFPVLSIAAEPEDWNAKFQSTYIWQAKPALNSPYASAHSLLGEREKSYSFTATAAFGARLGHDTEVYFDPELAQGVPLSGLLGLAGFSNGEMARSSGDHPVLYRARLFARHVIGLSDDKEDVESAMNQLGGQLAKRRIVLTVGAVPVLDIFDANAYSHDPRSQFMNWSFMTHAAYDYAADARGYTWGAAAEYFGDGWAIRAGRFALPKEPNQLALDTNIGRHHGDQVELERHYALGDEKPGVLRLLAFRDRALMSRYTDALALAATNGQAPDINQVRTGERAKYGLGLNLEQQVAKDLGVFGRAMWADGQTETYAFTESDRSLSTGTALGGGRWGRASDCAGLAIGQSMLSGPHRSVLAQGGQTFFLGDGRLNYAPERVLEAYYLFSPMTGLALTLDVQRIFNPGYNAARGPASFVAARVHVEL